MKLPHEAIARPLSFTVAGQPVGLGVGGGEGEVEVLAVLLQGPFAGHRGEGVAVGAAQQDFAAGIEDTSVAGSGELHGVSPMA